MTVKGDEGLGEADDGLQVEEFQVGRAVFKHPVGYMDAFVEAGKAVGIILQCPIQVLTEFGAEYRGEDVLEE